MSCTHGSNINHAFYNQIIQKGKYGKERKGKKYFKQKIMTPFLGGCSKISSCGSSTLKGYVLKLPGKVHILLML